MALPLDIPGKPYSDHKKRRAYALLSDYQRFPPLKLLLRLFLSIFLALLQSGHLWGSFSNPFSW
jgi:hypothetical protein